MLVATLLAGSIAPFVAAAPPQVTFLPAGTQAQEVSDDGNVVVGTTASTGFRWTPRGGYAVLSGPAASLGVNVAVSADGSSITSDVLDANNKMHAAMWAGGSTWNQFPAFVSCDAFLLNAYDINANGSIVVGLAWIAGCQAHAFRWDATNGTVDLGTIVAGRSSRANAVNGVGDIIVGWQDMSNGTRRGARWINGVEGYMPSYVSPGGTSYMVGEALCINNAGTQIAGYNVFSLAGGNAWKWSAATGQTTLLPQLAGFTGQAALTSGITEDGSIVVGTTGGIPIGRKAIIWINGQPQDLKTYIESKGGSIAPYNSLGTAMAITPDGRTIVGWGAGAGQPAGWIVHFPPDCPADLDSDGTVGPADLGILLGAWGGTGTGDINGDGSVGADDLAILLGAWGSC